MPQFNITSVIEEEPQYLETCYAVPKSRYTVVLNKIPDKNIDNNNFYFITQLRISNLDIKRIKVFANNIPINMINRDELTLLNLEQRQSQDQDKTEFILPIDLTGFCISRDEPNKISIQLELDKSKMKQYLVVQMIGTNTPPSRPIGYLQRGFLGSFHVESNCWLKLELDGLISKIHFISKTPFQIDRVKHDEYAFMNQKDSQLVNNKFWCEIGYDAMTNFKRFKSNSYHIVLEEDQNISIYMERVAHNFNGDWGLEQLVERRGIDNNID